MGGTQRSATDADIGEWLQALAEERGLGLDGLTRVARRAGLAWTRATVWKVQKGQRALTAEEFLRLAPCLGPVGDLAESLASLVNSRRSERLVKELEAVSGLSEPNARRAIEAVGEAEARAARRLAKLGVDMTPNEVSAAAVRLFGGRTLTEERDIRLASAGGPRGDLARARGHVMRHLVDDLAARVKAEDGWVGGQQP